MRLVANVTGCTGVKSVSLRQSINSAAYAEVICVGHELSIGDVVSIELGYQGDSGLVLSGGLVKGIKASVPGYEYSIEIYDQLVLASDAYIAPDNPDSPYTANNVEASVLFGNLLSTFAGITNYSGDATIFTFGVPNPTPIKMVSVMDMLTNIAKITNYIFYDDNGTVRFRDRRPYLLDSDTPGYVISEGPGGNILGGSYSRSDKALRNRVVVYGSPGVQATAQAGSPYLPTGYYKTAVISHELIQSNAQAQETANLNLAWLNRLSETCEVTIIGRWQSRPIDIVGVTSPFWGMTDYPFFCVSCHHNLGTGGYETVLTLVR